MLGQQPSTAQDPHFRIDIRTRNLLMPDRKSAAPPPKEHSTRLPEPVFPQYPELLGDVEPNPRYVPSNGGPYRTRITPFILRRAMRGWLYPYLRSRIAPGDFNPIISYLFTEWKCNLDCHYSANQDWGTVEKPRFDPA